MTSIAIVENLYSKALASFRKVYDADRAMSEKEALKILAHGFEDLAVMVRLTYLGLAELEQKFNGTK
jgi:hypothetical protein